MRRTIMALGIALFGTFLVTNSSQASDWPKLEKKLNPERKRTWVVIGDKETFKFFSKPMRKYGISSIRGLGFGLIGTAEGSSIESSSPLITGFAPDRTSLEKIDPKYHYLFVIPISEIEKILAEKKSIIVSRKVKINVVRQTLDDKGEWAIVSETEGESYITLIAAPNKRTLKKAITRFFTLSEIPLEPITFAAK